MIHHLAAAALIAAQASPAAPQRCLTREQAGDVAVTVMPMFLGALTQRCRPHVAANAFLNTGAEAMLTRLREAAAPRRASAFAAFAQMSRPPAADANDQEEPAAEESENESEGMEESADEAADEALEAAADAAEAAADAVEGETEDQVDNDGEDDEQASSSMAEIPFDLAANPEAVEAFATLAFAAAFASMDQRACSDASALVESLAPLPPENIARLAGAVLGMIGNAKPDMPNNPLCPA